MYSYRYEKRVKYYGHTTTERSGKLLITQIEFIICFRSYILNILKKFLWHKI